MTSPLLDRYRKLASFNPMLLKNIVEGEEHVILKQKLYTAIQHEPIFQRDFKLRSREELRELNHRRWKRINELKLVPSSPFEELAKFQALVEVLDEYDQGLGARIFLHSNVFGAALESMGTERHRQLLRQSQMNEIVGCFCLTELSHGSNTAEMQTVARFEDGGLVFNTPNIGAAKCWAGNLSHSATHAIVFAQLHVAGKSEGLHAFILQIRNPETYQPLPGITIGDMGEKPGCWNGVENGWMVFRNHRAPLIALLNKGCDITEDGRYVSSFKSTSEKQSVSLGTLSIGRLGIINKGALACRYASAIALRWSVARRQFGPQKGVENEIPVFEYPLQQYRLFPYLAASYVLRIFQKRFTEHFGEYMGRVIQGEKSPELADYAKEIHALSSSAKPTATWLGGESLVEARKACGGHGYLHLSRLNQLRDDFDPSQTYEGENWMILQQTSNILIAKQKSPTSPMGTYEFFEKGTTRFSTWTDSVADDAIDAYNFLLTALTKQISDEARVLKSQGKDSFEVRNETQVHRAVNLSMAYSERTAIVWTKEFIEEVDSADEKAVLTRMLNLYSLFVLERHLATLYIVGYASDGSFGLQLRQKLRQAVEDLKNDAIALVDAAAPPDFFLHSALGVSDGRAYERIMDEWKKHENERPGWLCDLARFLKTNEGNNSKL